MRTAWVIGGVLAGVFFLFFIACAGFVVVLVGGVMTATQPVVDASDEFLALLGRGEVAQAYAATSSGFRAQQDEASFTAAVERLGLAGASSPSWHSREIKHVNGSGEGLVKGTVRTKDGRTRPIVLRLIEEGGTWKIVGVRFDGVDLERVGPQR
jgi:hypothetical protein